MAADGGNGDKLPRILPRRFNSLVPKLKASYYDYIIFDMPPVSQISITPRLAGFMDMVLLVIESEKTDREVVKRATSMFAGSKANISAVLNKNRDYVPKRLSQDLCRRPAPGALRPASGAFRTLHPALQVRRFCPVRPFSPFVDGDS